jgi:beta-N-acetylhexosaminidase
MTSHVVYRALDAERPATLSPAVVDGLLRADLGFEGVVVSDDLEMGAMRCHFGFDDVVRGACAAGHDVLCIAHDAGLHSRAAELLRDGLSDGADWYGDPAVVDARLDALPFPAVASLPDPTRAASVAEAIAGRAITILRDEAGRIPVTGPCVLALPTLRRETEVEDPLRGEDDAASLADALGETEVVRVSTEPTGDELDALLATAGDRSLLVASTNARFLDGQRAYVRRCLQEHPRAVLLAIRSPFDAEVASDLDASIVLSYGFRPVQLRALAAVVRGMTRAYGQLPT